MIIIRDKMIIMVEMVIMVDIIIMVEDRHVNLTFQVTCVWQLSQFLRCLLIVMLIILELKNSMYFLPWAMFLIQPQNLPCGTESPSLVSGDH